MSLLRSLASTTLALVALAGTAGAQTTRPTFDEKLAKSVGADARGMRSYVLVILKTGPTRVPNGPERDDMFKGHFANMERLSDAGKLAVAGPFGNNADGWRGLFVFAVADIDVLRLGTRQRARLRPSTPV